MPPQLIFEEVKQSTTIPWGHDAFPSSSNLLLPVLFGPANFFSSKPAS
jgi:hypothetical protein